jgi:acyl carrier protein
MPKSDFLRKLEVLLELDPEELKGDEELVTIERWDSLGLMGFIALVDRTLQVRLSGKQITKAKTVNDLVALLGDRITS